MRKEKKESEAHEVGLSVCASVTQHGHVITTGACCAANLLDAHQRE